MRNRRRRVDHEDGAGRAHPEAPKELPRQQTQKKWQPRPHKLPEPQSNCFPAQQTRQQSRQRQMIYMRGLHTPANQSQNLSQRNGHTKHQQIEDVDFSQRRHSVRDLHTRRHRVRDANILIFLLTRVHGARFRANIKRIIFP